MKGEIDFLNSPVELLFIDGLHEYSDVKLDFKVWCSKLVDGGIILFHDLRGPWFGPRKVFRDYICKSNKFKEVGLCETIGFARKVQNNSFYDKVKGRWVLFLTYFFDVGQLIYKVKFLRPLLNICKKIIS